MCTVGYSKLVAKGGCSSKIFELRDKGRTLNLRNQKILIDDRIRVSSYPRLELLVGHQQPTSGFTRLLACSRTRTSFESKIHEYLLKATTETRSSRSSGTTRIQRGNGQNRCGFFTTNSIDTNIFQLSVVILFQQGEERKHTSSP